LGVDPDALVAPGLLDELQGRGILPARTGDGQWPAQIEVQKGPALALIFAGQDVVVALAIKSLQWRRGRPFFRPGIAVVPPGNDWRDVQVLSLHEELDITDGAMHVQVAWPPALRGQVRQAPQLDSEFLPSIARQGKRAGMYLVLRAALDLERA